jgi:hypothetical protein
MLAGTQMSFIPNSDEQAPTAVRLLVSCPGCGLQRALPSLIHLNDTFALLPCPKCGTGLAGTLREEGVEPLDLLKGRSC